MSSASWSEDNSVARPSKKKRKKKSIVGKRMQHPPPPDVDDDSGDGAKKTEKKNIIRKRGRQRHQPSDDDAKKETTGENVVSKRRRQRPPSKKSLIAKQRQQPLIAEPNSDDDDAKKETTKRSVANQRPPSPPSDDGKKETKKETKKRAVIKWRQRPSPSPPSDDDAKKETKKKKHVVGRRRQQRRQSTSPSDDSHYDAKKKKSAVGKRARPPPSASPTDEGDSDVPGIIKRIWNSGDSEDSAQPEMLFSATTQQRLLFQDDMTGRKPIRPNALRYSLKVVEQEAERATKAVSASLMGNGEEEESRKVLVKSSQHASKIVERVRETLRKANMPARYIRTVDVSLHSIDATNKKRRDDIEGVKNQLARLKKKKRIFDAEFQTAKTKCDELRASLGRKRDTTEIFGLETHPLLQDFINKQGSNKNEAAIPAIDENRSLAVKRPDDESKFVSALLENMRSIYD